MLNHSLQLLLLLSTSTAYVRGSPFFLYDRAAQNNRGRPPITRTRISTTTSSATAATTTAATTTAATTTAAATTAAATTSTTSAASVTASSTLSSVASSTVTSLVPTSTVTSTNGALQVTLSNNLGSANLKAWIVGTINGASTFVGPDGQLSSDQSASTISVPTSGASVTIPSWISSGRIYFADTTSTDALLPLGASGEQPSLFDTSGAGYRLNWGFVELTTSSSQGLFANLAHVDFVGLPVGISANGQTAKGVPANGVSLICDTLNGQGGPWTSLCITPSGASAPRRVLAPSSDVDSAFGTYWDSYISQVWTGYASKPLNIDTQSSLGTVACTFSSTGYSCGGESFTKPTSDDIWGCASGPFASDSSAVGTAQRARVCAAFHRSTLLLGDGSTQPGPAVSEYYTDSITNYYAKAVHATELDGRGYAFSFDDVGPSNAGGTTAGVLTGSVGSMSVTIGGWT